MSRLRIIVRLWVKDGRIGEFTDFEDKAIEIMQRHGAIVISIQKTHAVQDGPPHEVHVLEFPDRLSLERYQSDPALLALSGIRSRCIAKTEVAIVDID